MAKTFKPSPFENLIKKYTLCGLCDGKIIDDSFLQCGCSVILCIYCNEKHSCKFHHQAVKFDSYKDNKSISFIHQLSALMTTNPSEKEKEKKGFLENSCSASLPDLDDLTVNETTNSELSFSQLFDDRCFRNEKPRNSINSTKRESISPRISYTLKRKQYLSDSEDESCDKSESILYKRLSDCNSSKKKKITKKMKFSNKNQETSICSSIEDDSKSVNSDRQPNERKRNNRKGRHSVPSGMSVSVEGDVSKLRLNEVSSPVPESCQMVEEINVTVKDIADVKNNYDVENNSSYLQEVVKDENINSVGSPVLNMSKNDKLCPNNIDRTFESSSLEKDIDEVKMDSSCNVDDSEITVSNMLDNINGIKKISKQGDEKTNNLIKKRNSIKHSKELKTHKQKTVKSDQQMKHKDNHILNYNHTDFDGFDQCDINASTLNYMLYTLTTPFNISDEMMFPIHYKGKTFMIHVKDVFDGESNENEYHYILKPFKTFQNHFVQTERQAETETKVVGSTMTNGFNIGEASVGRDGEKAGFIQTDSYQVVDACVGRDCEKTVSVQTDGYHVVDACVGRDGEKAGFIQTDSYQVVDACVGRDGEKAGFIQTDSYQVVNACVGPEGKISEVSQTERYEVRDSYTSTKNFRCCAVQTDLVNNSPDLWSRNCAVQADLYNNKSSDNSSDMPYCTSANLHYSSSNMVKENTTSEITRKATADARESSDNEDEDIIEGTPVKVNNLSLTSLNLSAVKERTLRFDWNESTVARDEVVSCSDLTNVDKLCVQKFTKCFGMEYSEYFNNKTTHLVVSPRLTHDSHKTFKYLIAIASKACIVSIDWVKDSLQRKEVLPVSEYIPTNQPGPTRCRINGDLPFAGLTLCVQLLTNYPGVKAMEALSKLCGAYIVENIEQYNSPQKWPFPRFCLFEDESHLTSQILNSCSKNHLVAINYEWVFDSVAAYCRQPISKYLCSTFILTDDIIETYKIPSDMLVNNSSNSN